MKSSSLISRSISAACIALILSSCQSDTSPELKSDETLLAEDLLSAGTFTLDTTQFAMPETTQLLDTGNVYKWDMFAWQTFIAMNWTAVQPDSANGFLRGYPDSTIYFGDVSESAVVWETFKEKREMFKHGATTSMEAKPDPWSSDYSNDVKYVYGSGKFSTLDETVQVKSEALEPYYQSKSADSIGSVIVARVFRGEKPSLSGAYTGPGTIDNTLVGPGNAVRYEVKVNYDFYNYVVDKGYYYDPTTYAAANATSPIQLPWRTSQTSVDVPNPYKVEGYTIANARKAYYEGRKQNNGQAPPKIGSVHVKAAWAPITEEEKDRFLYRSSEYFSGTGDPKQTAQALFGLVGLHIIQRIKADQKENSPVGGAFIFSTWEHKDIRDTVTTTTYNFNGESVNNTQYTYTNYFGNESTGFTADPALDNPFYVARLYPILQHTQEANTMVSHLLSKSVWSNYRLVGTQFEPFDFQSNHSVTQSAARSGDRGPFSPDTVSVNDKNGQPIFLSNLVIETNVGLQQFQGMPPQVITVQGYQKYISTNASSNFIRFNNSDSKFGNILYGQKPNNSGGCMGCHGVAQLNGYSFSFVLLAGQKGADPDSEIDFLEPITSQDTLVQSVGAINKMIESSSGGM